MWESEHVGPTEVLEAVLEMSSSLIGSLNNEGKRVKTAFSKFHSGWDLGEGTYRDWQETN